MATTISKDTILGTFRLDRETVDKVIAKIEELIHASNARRAVVKDASGHTVLEAPLTVGLVGAALAPFWAAIAAVAALAADFTVQIERREE